MSTPLPPDSPSPYAGPVPTPPPPGTSATTIVLIVLGVLFVVMLVCGGVLVALLLPAVGGARQAARQMQSQNNLKQIGLALHNYHSVHSTLPPAYTTDENGNPLLSWRVLILPYIEEGQLFDSFDPDQPWDGPANQALAQAMPNVYRSPTYGQASTDQTHYTAIRSPQSVFPGPDAIEFDNVTDGLANTIAVAELPNRSVTWTRPDDSDPSHLYAAFQAADADHVTVLFTDGAVARLASSTSQADVEAMITRDGGESVVIP